MNWDEFRTQHVKIEYANMAKMNKIRAWALKNNSYVQVERYAKDAYTGIVKIPMKQGRDEQMAIVNEFNKLFN